MVPDNSENPGQQRRITMIKEFILKVIGIVAVACFLACESVPPNAITDARTALEKAEKLGGRIWAPTLLKTGYACYDSAMKELSVEKRKLPFRRNYKKVIELLDIATEAGYYALETMQTENEHIMAEFPRVLLVENHSDVLVHWVRTKVRNAVVVNMDAHDDCNPISPEKAGKLRNLLANGDVAAIERANSISDSGLYGIATYIAAACALGITNETVWIAPKVQEPGLLNKSTDFRVRTYPLESLPKLRGPVFLTVDADIIPPFAAYRCINEVEAVRLIGKKLRAVPWNVVHASVCFSVDGGFLPVTLRWVGNALHEALDGKDPSRPNAPWPLLCKVEDWRRSLLPREVVRRVRPLVLQRPADPWLRIYLADALFRTNDVSGAMTESLKATHLDPGCCYILHKIGRQLADAGRIDGAERFLAAAPAVVNIPAELALVQALEQAGHTARAIEHLLRISKMSAYYSTELLIGYGYERLGDSTRTLQHYLRAVALLDADIGYMPDILDIGPALASAERFLQSTGNKKQAQVLRQDRRLVKFFVDNKETGGVADQ